MELMSPTAMPSGITSTWQGALAMMLLLALPNIFSKMLCFALVPMIIKSWCSFLIALSFVFAGSFLGAPPCNEDDSGTLFGTVTDSNGDDLSGVTVSVSGNTDTTNNSGYYCIPGLTVNNSNGNKRNYTVTFSKNGYTTVTENNVTLDDDAGKELNTEMSTN